MMGRPTRDCRNPIALDQVADYGRAWRPASGTEDIGICQAGSGGITAYPGGDTCRHRRVYAYFSFLPLTVAWHRNLLVCRCRDRLCPLLIAL